jgi:hypothetical protein
MPSGIGARELEARLDRLTKDNFDLKLKDHARRQEVERRDKKIDVLCIQANKLQETVDRLQEKVERMEDMVQEGNARAKEAERRLKQAEERRVQSEQRLLEERDANKVAVEKRDQIWNEAADRIIYLEDELDKVESRLERSEKERDELKRARRHKSRDEPRPIRPVSPYYHHSKDARSFDGVEYMAPEDGVEYLVHEQGVEYMDAAPPPPPPKDIKTKDDVNTSESESSSGSKGRTSFDAFGGFGVRRYRSTRQDGHLATHQGVPSTQIYTQNTRDELSHFAGQPFPRSKSVVQDRETEIRREREATAERSTPTKRSTHTRSSSRAGHETRRQTISGVDRQEGVQMGDLSEDEIGGRGLKSRSKRFSANLVRRMRGSSVGRNSIGGGGSAERKEV